MRQIKGLKYLLLGVLLFGYASIALASSSLEEKVVEHQLANGLKLLVVERHDTPVVSAYITIGVGSVHETSETRGVAHLLEHMLFKGTKTLGTTDYEKEKPLPIRALLRPMRKSLQVCRLSTRSTWSKTFSRIFILRMAVSVITLLPARI
jgi:predicted Zn-dependent peptidase